MTKHRLGHFIHSILIPHIMPQGHEIDRHRPHCFFFFLVYTPFALLLVSCLRFEKKDVVIFNYLKLLIIL